MAEIKRLSVALPAPKVRRAVSDGEYASTSEVVRDALRLWESRRHLRERDVSILRDRRDSGKASGRAGLLDVRRVLSEETGRVQRQQAPTWLNSLSPQ